ncbi:MAG: hypothetical protein KA314_07010 [Chloroflexi bacterium]|nr:hypothetical protein [Chloroflexota bacterium]MBP8055574.1 hypothetical protein [Chloroflexota bacterium]
MGGQEDRRTRWVLGIILLAYLVVTIGYGIVNPLFEAPDENWHYFTVQYVAEMGRLPVVMAEYDEFMSQEAAQPPLYYMLGALLIAPIDTAAAREQVWPNPFGGTGNAAALTNRNQFIHTVQEEWPWRGYVLAGHILRLFSTFLGLGTLICVYYCVDFFFGPAVGYPQSRVTIYYPLLATAMVAFWPQFNFVHASVTNDGLITFLCAAALGQLLALSQRFGATSSGDISLTGSGLLPFVRCSLSVPYKGRLLLLGLTVAAAVLSKNAGTLLLLFCLGFFVVMAWWKREVKVLGAAAIYTLLPVLLLSGWLWWRNWLLYGDPTAATVFVRIAGGDRGYTLWQVLAETPGLWASLFAIFGWFNVRASESVFWVWYTLVAVALIGWGIRFVSRGQRNKVIDANMGWPDRTLTLLSLLLMGWVLLVYVGLVSFMLKTPAAQGRLLFPALVPLVLGLVGGWQGWEYLLAYRDEGLPKGGIAHRNYARHRVVWRVPYVLYTFPGLALLTTLVCLGFVIPEAYARPQTIPQLPATVMPLNEMIGDGLHLIGAQIETLETWPGEPVWLTLYWQAQPVPVEAPEIMVEFFGLDLTTPVARLHSYHGRGLFPASLWPEGVIIADRTALRLTEEADVPVVARGFVRVVDDVDGVYFGKVKVIPAQWPVAPQTILATVGEEIELRQVNFAPEVVEPGDVVVIQVIWRAAAATATDLTTFIHLGDPAESPLATGDNQPRQGHYPTSAWAVGEVIEDEYYLTIPLNLPAGKYPLVIGMYDAAADIRLSLMVAGQRQLNDAYLVGYLVVE